MNRLTHQGAKNTVVYGNMLADFSGMYFPNKGVRTTDLCLKLGQLEDIEEELVGISLITLFRALKYGIWIATGGLPPFYTKKITMEGNGFRCHTSDEYVSFKDHGLSWAVDKRVLEK